MLDRTKAPALKQIQNIKTPDYNHYTLDNGIPVYEIDAGTQDVLKIEFIFLAGRPFEAKRAVARTTSALLREGTKDYSAIQIAELTDFYGATLRTSGGLDKMNITLFTLNKHLENLLPLLKSLLQEPLFEETELQNFKTRSIQRLKLSLDKNDVVAYRTITEALYGDQHIYGYNTNKADYVNLNQSDLIEHFKKTYTADNCKLFVSGKMTKNTRQLLNQYLGNGLHQNAPKPIIQDITPARKKNIYLPKLKKPQSAIRIGRRLFNRHHEDYHRFYILNMLLGGYFGSRLMMNIREDKGYTYGIYSSLESLQYDGFFFIGTEVGKEVTNLAVEEIYKELERLRTHKATPEELAMVKNYIMGNMLTNLDGAFNAMNIIRVIKTNDLAETFFDNFVKTVKHISPEDLQILAQKYLNPSDMHEVIVGTK